MPARRDPGSKRVTRLAEVRHWRGATQQDLADRVGMSLNTYRRLELGQVRDPPLHSLVNCAQALGVPLADVLEPEWLEWWDPFDALPRPPKGGFWPGPGPRQQPDWLSQPPPED